VSHSSEGPSSLEKRAHCPGSKREEHGLEDTEFDSFRDSGVTCHEAMEYLIGAKPLPALDHDEYAMVKTAVDRLNLSLAGDAIIPGGYVTRNGGIVMVEKNFKNLPYSLPNDPQEGTVDLVVWYKGSHILLIDWKFGGSYVNHPKWNRQMKGYALGIWGELELVPIHVAIVQPQAGEYMMNPWIYEPDDYDSFLQELQGIVIAANAPDAECHVGQGCKFCKAAKHLTCETRLSTLGVLGELGPDWKEGFRKLDSTGRGRILTAVKASADVAERIVAFSKDLIREEGEVPRGWSATPVGKNGLRLAPRPSQLSWPTDSALQREPVKKTIMGIRI
jgi:hypothetical protein